MKKTKLLVVASAVVWCTTILVYTAGPGRSLYAYFPPIELRLRGLVNGTSTWVLQYCVNEDGIVEYCPWPFGVDPDTLCDGTRAEAAMTINTRYGIVCGLPQRMIRIRFGVTPTSYTQQIESRISADMLATLTNHPKQYRKHIRQVGELFDSGRLDSREVEWSSFAALLLLPLSALCGVACLWVLLAGRVHRRRLRRGECPRCRYDLVVRQGERRCTECGFLVVAPSVDHDTC